MFQIVTFSLRENAIRHSYAEAGDVSEVDLVLGIQKKIDKLMQENSEINEEMTRLAERRQNNDNRIKEQFLHCGTPQDPSRNIVEDGGTPSNAGQHR